MSAVEGCPACGSVLPELAELRELVAEQAEALALCERELRGKRAQIARLQKEQAAAPTADPLWDQAKAIFAYWREQLHPKAREFNDARRDKVLARLRAGATVAEIKLAIDGCRASDFHTSKGHTDLELICRDEQHLHRFQRLAGHEPEPEPELATSNGNGQMGLDDLRERKESIIDAVQRVLRA